MVWNIESKLEKIMSDLMEEKPDKKANDDNLIKQIDLENVSGHQCFNYEVMLKRIAD